jgi:pectinesterase
VVDRWYRDGHYHKDTGEGMDMYDVGASRGCGGTGVWSDNKLYPAVNYTAYRVLANGPIRAVFELSFPLWDADGFQLSVVKRYTVDAGKSLDRIDSTFSFATHAASGETKLFIAAGLARHKTNGAVTKNESERWLSYWEDYGKNGQLGTAVVLDPEQDIQFAEDRLNHLAVTRLGASKRLTYYAGAGWTNSPYFKSQQDWHAYLSAFTAALKAPLQVEYSSK